MLTRREGYPESTPVPPLDIPEAGQHIWDWFAQVSQRVARIHDGRCDPIPPSEWLAWRVLSGELVRPWEQQVLWAMDIAFCTEMSKELEAKHAEITEKGKGKK